ncbi:CAP domain-containing protein [Sphingomonas melonis]|uniref:CAP domain-containing protein n=1 Tax=Sphingomonas melonis TaxID=152682 RepID=UPI00300257CA
MAAMIAKRYRALALPLLLLACAQAPEGPERVIEPRVSASAAPRGSVLLKSVMLAAHNRARGEVGVAPLVWSDTLASSARGYAEEMARTGRFEHAAQPMGPGRQGENLWTGTRGRIALTRWRGIGSRRSATS